MNFRRFVILLFILSVSILPPAARAASDKMADMPMDHPADAKAGKTDDMPMGYAPPDLVAHDVGSVYLEAGKTYQSTFRLTDAHGKPVAPDDLEEMHAHKIHMLIIDQSLGDYQHVHPVYTGRDGVYSFSFTPFTAHDYMFWIDVSPKGSHAQMVPGTLFGTEPCKVSCLNATVNERAPFDGGAGVISFMPLALHAGHPAIARVDIVDKKRMAVRDLQPVMGAIAHIAVFSDDLATAQHLHPLGHDDPALIGASPIFFRITPQKPGFLRIFVQINVGGKDVFLPFGQRVD